MPFLKKKGPEALNEGKSIDKSTDHVKSRARKQKNKKYFKYIIIALILGGVIFGGITIFRDFGRSSELKNLINEKNIEIVMSKDNKFINVTGNDINDLDLAAVLSKYHKEKPSVVTAFWVKEKTDKKPDEYSDNVISSSKFIGKNRIQATSHLKIQNVKSKDMDDIYYQIDSKESATSNKVLNVKTKFTGNLSDDGILAEVKNISDLIDKMNPDKNYDRKVIRISFKNNEYTFEDKHPDRLLKSTYFEVE